MSNLSLTGEDVDALSRVAQSEVGHWKGNDLYNGVRGVVDTAINRTATGAYGTEGDLQTGLDAKAQYSKVGGPKGVGTWSKLDPASDEVSGS